MTPTPPDKDELDERLEPQDELEHILSAMAFRCAGGITHSGRKEYMPAKQAINRLIAKQQIAELKRLKLGGTVAGNFAPGGDGEDIVIVEGHQIDSRIATLEQSLKEPNNA